MAHIIFGSLTAFFCGIDLWCKSWVEKNIEKGKEKNICKEKIAVRNVRNEGFAMGIGEDKPEIVRVISAIVGGIVAVYSIVVWKKGESVLQKIGMAMVLSGAISNTYDRLKRKYVVDYLGFRTKWEKFNRLTFNLGDVFILVGAICCVLGELKSKK